MRSRRSRLLALALLPAAVAACGPGPEPESAPARPAEPETPALVAPEVPEEPRVDVDAAPAAAPDREAQLAKQELWRERMDELARGLVASFESRVYTPERDGELRYAEGVASVRSGDAEGAFRLTFDVARPEDERVTVVPEGGTQELPKGAERQVRMFAETALNGPYRTVVQYLPPIQLLLTYSQDRKYKIVTAPGHQHDLQVSYRFDERELISHRGISVLPAAEITNYEWTVWRGRYLLSRFWLHGTGGTCDLEYDDRDSAGVTLLRRALLRKDQSSFDVAFTWERVEAGAPEPPRER